MSYLIIELADGALAEEIVEDTKKTDSMCITLENGDELEFEVLSIECKEKADG